ncbi:MAG: hypothetical protein HAW63_02480 [Bdellovibrionaceae bacterium]|nr:hypothetical protein [Pseudobdellovibrionaceae bacterium]
MSSSSRIFVVSLYGKGHYIASLLSQEGYSVSLLNLQDPQPSYCPTMESLAGPFDFFEGTTNPLQEAFLNSFFRFKNSTSGFTLWLPSGPIDFQSFIKHYALDSCGLHAENIEYLSNTYLLSPSEKTYLRKSLSQLPHSENWLSGLAHQLPSSTFSLQPYDFKNTITKALPLFNKKKIISATQNTLQASLDWCATNKVEVINIDSQLSFSKIKNNIETIDYTNAETKQKSKIPVSQIVWTLNSQKTKNFFPKIFPLLYKEVLKPVWQWQKITLHLNETSIPDIPTSSFLLLNNPMLYFAGDNLGIVKKTSLPNVWSLWLCLPQQRPSEKIIKAAIPYFFKKRIPQLKIQKIDIPKHNPSPLFPVFEHSRTPHTKNINNLHFCNFEASSNLDWPNFLNFQKNIANRIKKSLKKGSHD